MRSSGARCGPPIPMFPTPTKHGPSAALTLLTEHPVSGFLASGNVGYDLGMAGRNDVLVRLRDATSEELKALAKILGMELGREPEENLVRLSDAYRKVASESDYRKIVAAVASEAASQAEWKRVEIKDSADAVWIEEYIYRVLAYVHRPDRSRLPDVEKAQLREQAEAALEGKLVSAQEASNATFSALGTVAGLGYVFGWWGLVGVAAVAVAGRLFGASMAKVVPATLILIHVRKRREFEETLRDQEAA